MEDFRFTTTNPHSTNEETMQEFLYEHFYERFCIESLILVNDGSYAEVQDRKDRLWAVHASGDGDFTSHRIRFELLKE